MPRGVPKQGFVKVYDLLVLMVEEIDLRPYDPKLLQFLEKSFARFWRAQGF